MSVVVDTPEGSILSHRDISTSRFKLKKELFNVCTPFIMDSAALRIAKEFSCQGFTKRNTSKKRKRSHHNAVFKEDTVDDMILHGFEKLVQIGIDLKYFESTPESETEWLDNNRTARETVNKLDTCSSHLLDVCDQYSQPSKLECSVLNSDSKSLQLPSLTLVKSESSEPIIVCLENQKYLIPEKSSFILGDVTEAVNKLATLEMRYDFILLDPPWINKSVKRKKKYWMVETESLRELHLQDIAEPDCLIAVWMTNNSDQNTFVSQVLFPAWSVTYLATWHWVKVTRKGKPVTPFESVHKKPYENLVLGRFRPSSLPGNTEAEKIFLSIPSIVHSHKPPVSELVKVLLTKPAPTCLELFARYLLPNWTSCGNEVLKLQHLNYYEEDRS